MSDRATVAIEGDKAYYRASASGQCVKALAGLRMGMTPLGPSEDMKRRFKDGHLHEDSIIEAAEEWSGQAIVRRQEEWTIELSSRVVVVGHVDGITSDTLQPVEAKSASKDMFKDWEHSVDRWFSKRPYYAAQWTLTLAGYDKTVGIYAVKNKDSGVVLCREIGAAGTLQEVKVRLLRADLDGRRGKLPECDSDDKFFCPLRYLHDDEDREPAEYDADMDGLARAYDEAREQEKRAGAVKKELSERIKAAMGERERVETDGFMVSMSSGVRMVWNQDKLREVLGDDISPYQNANPFSYPRVTAKKVEE